jgi:GntR family transcriptional repressor for pyruvate dehydrogenase complex
MQATNKGSSQIEFKRMNRVSVSEEIITHIEELILGSRLKPGEQLPSEEKMAAQMGVGRGTVREALKVLIYLGLLDRKKKGTFVSHLAPERVVIKNISEKFRKHRDVMEMIELRKVIEPEGAGLAAERAGESEVKRIADHYRSMVEVQRDVERFIDYDNRFHLDLIKAAGNNLLKEIMESIQQVMIKNQSLILHRSRAIMPRSLDFHLKILTAVRDGDRSLAKKNMMRHILDIQKEMYLILQEEER